MQPEGDDDDAGEEEEKEEKEEEEQEQEEEEEEEEEEEDGRRRCKVLEACVISSRRSKIDAVVVEVGLRRRQRPKHQLRRQAVAVASCGN